ncbi:amino acid adenylation domain-containing protein [Micromonospora sp. ANENR4]|uniref:non-ribosomal peptide synthetase n=1 Tax=unclassified Micromonospora TaxID=2617518 RepID=UPI00188E071A|nr:non-ribosomal peptide synthetase [Micromonospora sp. WMMC273]MBF5033663.1 amino acid adenylation domain-containing protein [Micromonospora sp. ANENR4]MCZ7476261.1 non-ribosomal peptide synthetase [Micromonospora sp. WMMC273]
MTSTAPSPALREAPAWPASYAQERMWVAEQLANGAPAYNLQMGLRIRGHLDVEALRQALDELAARHDALRTRFVVDGARLTCVVTPPGRVPLAMADLSRLGDPAGAVAERAERELGTRFEPATGETYRAVLLTTDAADHTLLLTMDHLIADPWSVQVLHEDLTQAYARWHAGEPPTDPVPAHTYGDFAAWQRDWLAGLECARQLAYWRDILPTDPPRLSLPVRTAARERQDMRRFAAMLEGELVDSANATARSARATLFTVLFSGYAALLGRYGQHQEVLVGSLCTGRTQPESERVVGFVANAVALRADLSGRPSLRDLVGRAREIVLDAYTNQDVPFDTVVETVRPDRAQGRRPFFDVMFQLADLQRQPLSLPDAVLEPLPSASRIAGADLVLTIAREGDGYHCYWDYDAGLLDAATVERMHGHYVRLLDAALAEPDRPMAEFEIVTGAEGAAIAAFSSPARPVDPGWTLPSAFEAVADRHPDRPALSGRVRADYAELNADANRLAHALQARGVGPEVVVGLFLDDRADVILGALGVLKAGGAYLPLDPAYPAARIQYMVDDARPALVLTRGPLTARVPAGSTTVDLDDLGSELAAASPANPARTLDPTGLAYVIYTSGSTGRPKGVGVVHRGLATVSAAQRHAFPLSPADRMLQFASPNFDASVLEALMGFGAGASLYLPDVEATADTDLERMLGGTRATATLLPPSALAGIVDESVVPETITVAGEACPVPLAEKWAASRTFINLYGPTEASIVSTSYRVEAGVPQGASLPIGRPLPGVRAFVVQQDGHTLAPVGVPGELLLGGDVLARGYLRRPGLTAERFLPDGFGGNPGGRLYRTGDLVRWRSDGVLEYLGRLDHQVKIRGFRIELGEIESTLATCPAVREAVVVARDGRLVAYVGVADAVVPEEALREHCSRTLPDYMVPARVSIGAALPKTPNGKIDRARLPDLIAVDPQERVPPRDELEQACAEIWRGVLNLDMVGAFDDFFALGGHSLAATRVVGHVRQAFGVDLPVRTLFEHPVLADFTAALVRWEEEHG